MMARSEMRDAARGKAEPVAPPVEAHKLDTAERQFEILNPKSLRYELVLEREYMDERVVKGVKVREAVKDHVKRAIVVPTEFALGDILTRRVRDDVESFGRLAMLEIGKSLPNGMTLGDVFEKDNGYMEVAFSKSNVRDTLHRLVATVAVFEDDANARPTAAEVAEGMDSADLSVIGMLYLTNALVEISRQKEARAAVVQ